MIFNSSDIFEFDNFPNPQSVNATPDLQWSDEFTNRYHPKAGTISFKNAMFPHMHVMDLRWKTEEAIEVYESNPSGTINVNFHMAGNLDTAFSGIHHDLNMRPKRHNLVFSPQDGFFNTMESDSCVEMFHISFEKNFFMDAIGCNDAWSEMVHRNILDDRPFSGISGTLQTTPQMLLLIEEIRTNKSAGPMQNLMIQSRVLELLALQIDQFRSPNGRGNEDMKPEEAQKLTVLKSFIEANFLNELSLAQLSRVCLLNEFKVKKGFKILFGDTVFGYVRKLRMEHAKKLLLDCGMSVEEVADILGYEHPQHFSVAFKKFIGVNPSKISMQHFQSFTTI